MADADAEDVVDYGWEDEEEDEQNETNQGDGTTNFQDELEQACRDFVRQKKKEAKENPNLTAKWPSQRGGYSHQRGGGWGAAGGGGKKGAQSNSISPKQNVVTSATLLHFVQENYGRWETLGLEGGFAAFASKILDTAEEKAAALLATFFEKDDLMKLLCLKICERISRCSVKSVLQKELFGPVETEKEIHILKRAVNSQASTSATKITTPESLVARFNGTWFTCVAGNHLLPTGEIAKNEKIAVSQFGQTELRKGKELLENLNILWPDVEKCLQEDDEEEDVEMAEADEETGGDENAQQEQVPRRGGDDQDNQEEPMDLTEEDEKAPEPKATSVPRTGPDRRTAPRSGAVHQLQRAQPNPNANTAAGTVARLPPHAAPSAAPARMDFLPQHQVISFPTPPNPATTHPPPASGKKMSAVDLLNNKGGGGAGAGAQPPASVVSQDLKNRPMPPPPPPGGAAPESTGGAKANANRKTLEDVNKSNEVKNSTNKTSTNNQQQQTGQMMPPPPAPTVGPWSGGGAGTRAAAPAPSVPERDKAAVVKIGNDLIDKVSKAAGDSVLAMLKNRTSCSPQMQQDLRNVLKGSIAATLSQLVPSVFGGCAPGSSSTSCGGAGPAGGGGATLQQGSPNFPQPPGLPGVGSSTPHAAASPSPRTQQMIPSLKNAPVNKSGVVTDKTNGIVINFNPAANAKAAAAGGSGKNNQGQKPAGTEAGDLHASSTRVVAELKKSEPLPPAANQKQNTGKSKKGGVAAATEAKMDPPNPSDANTSAEPELPPPPAAKTEKKFLVKFIEDIGAAVEQREGLCELFELETLDVYKNALKQAKEKTGSWYYQRTHEQRQMTKIKDLKKLLEDNSDFFNLLTAPDGRVLVATAAAYENGLVVVDRHNQAQLAGESVNARWRTWRSRILGIEDSMIKQAANTWRKNNRAAGGVGGGTNVNKEQKVEKDKERSRSRGRGRSKDVSRPRDNAGAGGGRNYSRGRTSRSRSRSRRRAAAGGSKKKEKESIFTNSPTSGSVVKKGAPASRAAVSKAAMPKAAPAGGLKSGAGQKSVAANAASLAALAEEDDDDDNNEYGWDKEDGDGDGDAAGGDEQEDGADYNPFAADNDDNMLEMVEENADEDKQEQEFDPKGNWMQQAETAIRNGTAKTLAEVNANGGKKTLNITTARSMLAAATKVGAAKPNIVPFKKGDHGPRSGDLQDRGDGSGGANQDEDVDGNAMDDEAENALLAAEFQNGTGELDDLVSDAQQQQQATEAAMNAVNGNAPLNVMPVVGGAATDSGAAGNQNLMQTMMQNNAQMLNPANLNGMNPQMLQQMIMVQQQMILAHAAKTGTVVPGMVGAAGMGAVAGAGGAVQGAGQMQQAGAQPQNTNTLSNSRNVEIPRIRSYAGAQATQRAGSATSGLQTQRKNFGGGNNNAGNNSVKGVGGTITRPGVGFSAGGGNKNNKSKGGTVRR